MASLATRGPRTNFLINSLCVNDYRNLLKKSKLNEMFT